MPETTVAVELLAAEPDCARSGPSLSELLAACSPETVCRLVCRVGLDRRGFSVPVAAFQSSI